MFCILLYYCARDLRIDSILPNPLFSATYIIIGDEVNRNGSYWTFDRVSTTTRKVSDYLERVSLYFVANGVAEEKQVAVLLTAIGGETYALLTNLLSPAKPCDQTYAEITAVLKAHFEPKPIIIAERFHFHRRQQGANETIAEYMAELRHLASTCEFKD